MGLYGPIVIGPVLESLIFLLVWWLVGRPRQTTSLGVLVRQNDSMSFVLIMMMIGWFFHGASLQSLGQAMAFAVLAIYFLRSLAEFELSRCLALLILSHFTWNSTVFVLSLVEK